MNTKAAANDKVGSDAARAASAALKAGCTLARRHAAFSTADYLAYRHQSDAEVPTLANVRRLFGSFELFRQAVERKQKRPGSDGVRTQGRLTDEKLICDLRHVAVALSTDELSTDVYDRFREANPSRDTCDGTPQPLASSSVIRKWLGRWATAVERAGLRPVSNRPDARLEVVEAIEAIREAKEDCGGRLTERAYERQRESERGARSSALPAASEIIALFSSWRVALQVAEVETGDAIRADEDGSPWAASEVRRLVDMAEAVLRRTVGADYELEAEGWTKIQAASRRPLPSWDTVTALLRV